MRQAASELLHLLPPLSTLGEAKVACDHATNKYVMITRRLSDSLSPAGLFSQGCDMLAP